MELIEDRKESRGKKKRRFEDGRLYFSRAAERKFFFSLTVIMLLMGLLFKLGVLQ
jgi:hypothetical protein